MTTTTPTATTVTIPRQAVIRPLDQQWATVALTRREVEQVLLAGGFSPKGATQVLTDWDRGWNGSTILRNGAVVQPGSWYRGNRPPTTARTFVLRGYHYAGTDVAELVEVAA